MFRETFDLSHLLLDPSSSADWVSAQIQHLRTQMESVSVAESPFVEKIVASLSRHIRVVLPTVEVFSLRALSLIATLPVIGICCVVVGVDGWVRREVRKAGAGIESARIYHFAKRSIKPLLLWVSLLYLTLPVTIDVQWAYGILVVAIPLLLGVTISRFKKYF